MFKFKGLLGSLHKNEKGITGLETAIILIAFVIVASVFAFVVLSTGLFSAEKGKEAVFAGLQKASGNLEVRGSVTAASAVPPAVDEVIFNIGLAAAGSPTLVDPLTIGDPNNIAINYIDADARVANTAWTTTEILGDGDTLLERGELMEVTVALPGGSALDINENFTLEVIPPSGGTLLINRTMPQQIDLVMDLVMDLHSSFPKAPRGFTTGRPSGRWGLGSMEVNTKLKELEEEFKVLKAEIRNVLLDIREVILDRTNPLGEEHESAHLTLDLNTTARAMATEVAAHEAVKANEEAEHGMDEHIEPPVSLLTASPGLVAANDDGVQDDPEPVAPEPLASNDELEEAPAPKVIRLNPTADSVEFQPEGQLPTEIPHMYQATVPPLSGNISISAWLTEALEAVGPQELERIITIHRLWGNLPSNISRALAYLQELLKQADENEPPPWLKVMQELDRLASL